MPSDLSGLARYNAGIPKDLAKKLKAREKEEKKGKCKTAEGRPSTPDYLEMRFVRSADGSLEGVWEDCRFALSEYRNGNPSEGETWRCMVGRGQMYGSDVCVPVERVSAIDEKEQDTERSVSEPAAEASPVDNDEVSGLKAEIERLRQEKAESDRRAADREAEAKRLAREKEEVNGELDSARRRIKDLENNNGQLRQQISARDRDSKNTNLTELRTKVATLESLNHTLQGKVERLELFIEVNGIDTENVENGLLFSVMTGSDVLHCAAFEDRRYTVQFGRGFKVLRLVPDEDGPVSCLNGDLRLPALSAYSKFEQLAKLRTSIEDGVITVEA